SVARARSAHAGWRRSPPAPRRRFEGLILPPCVPPADRPLACLRLSIPVPVSAPARRGRLGSGHYKTIYRKSAVPQLPDPATQRGTPGRVPQAHAARQSRRSAGHALASCRVADRLVRIGLGPAAPRVGALQLQGVQLCLVGAAGRQDGTADLAKLAELLGS